MPLLRTDGQNRSIFRFVRRAASFVAYVARRFDSDDGLQIASALTYTTLLAVVPLLAVSLAVLSGFGGFATMREEVRELLLGFFLPSAAEQINEYITGFLQNTRQLTAPGIIGLSITAILTLATIEATFNRIWRAGLTRSWPTRILIFWAVLTLGPLLLGASLSLRASLWAYTDEQAPLFRWVEDIRFAGPFVIQWLAFSLLYLVVPATRVRIVHALIGGLAAVLLFTVLRLGFGMVVDSLDNYRTIYGALAAIPILLLWLYAFWTVLLIGAHVAAALPERLAVTNTVSDTAAARLEAALLLLAEVWWAAGRRKAVILDDDRHRDTRWLAPRLIAAGLIAPSGDDGVVAACDFARVPIADLWQALDIGTPLVPKELETAALAKMTEAERQGIARPLVDLLPKLS